SGRRAGAAASPARKPRVATRARRRRRNSASDPLLRRARATSPTPRRRAQRWPPSESTKASTRPCEPPRRPSEPIDLADLQEPRAPTSVRICGRARRIGSANRDRRGDATTVETSSSTASATQLDVDAHDRARRKRWDDVAIQRFVVDDETPYTRADPRRIPHRDAIRSTAEHARDLEPLPIGRDGRVDDQPVVAGPHTEDVL